MKYTETPLTDTQPQLLIQITTKPLTIRMNLNTKHYHKNYQKPIQKTILNLYKHKTPLKYQPNLHQYKNYPS